MQYRSEIDGLRSIAVTSVVLNHAGWDALPGGFLGVDVFFVISGFLITAILLRDLKDNNFSIVAFYERRFRRIIPALTVVLLATTVPAAFLLSPTQLVEFGRSIIATSIFVSNYLFVWEVDYFANASDLKPLLHTWSLAVEEQFYVVFPILLWFLYARGAKALLIGIGAALLVSIVAAQYGAANFPKINFFLTTSRIWELAVGCLAAIIYDKRKFQANNWLATIGLAMLLLPMLLYGDRQNAPSIFTAVPVAGTALVVVFANQSSCVGKVLALPPLVLIGLMSYSTYLWHQPILAYARLWFNGEPPAGVTAILVISAFALAWITWKFVETPARKIKTGLFSRNWVFIWSAISILASVSIGALFASQTIKSSVRVDNLLIDPIAEARANHNWFIDNPEFQTEWKAFSDPSKINVLVAGDSHANGVFNMLFHKQNTEDLPDFQFIRHAFPMQCFEKRGNGGKSKDIIDYCMNSFESSASKALIEHADIILYSIRWTDKTWMFEFIPGLVEWGSKRNIKTVVLSNSPEWLKNPSQIMRNIVAQIGREKISAHEINEAFGVHLDPKINQLNAILKEYVEQSGAMYMSKQDYACTRLDLCFAATPDLEATYIDTNHISKAASRLYAERIDQIDWLAPIRKLHLTSINELPSVSDEAPKLLSRLEGVLGVERGLVIEGTPSDDRLAGTDGNDTIRSGNGNDTLIASSGNNLLVAGPGNDVLYGGDGERDQFDAGAGNDEIYLTARRNRVRGGPGADVFYVEFKEGNVLILDFDPGEGDLIDVSSYLGPSDFGKLNLQRGKRRSDDTLIRSKGRLIILRSFDIELLKSAHFNFSDSINKQ